VLIGTTKFLFIDHTNKTNTLTFSFYCRS